MRKKLFRSLVLFSTLISLLLSILLIGGMYMYFNNQLQTQLREEANMLVSILKDQEDPAAYLGAGIFVNRVTLIDQDGRVWFDSVADSQTMENHADRPEIIAAFRSGSGNSNRSSATIGETSVYYAIKLNDTYVLRVAGALKSVWMTVSGMIVWIVLGFAISMILAYQLAKPITDSLIRPLNKINLDDPLQSDAYEEFSPMLRRMDAQNRRIAEQMREQKRHQTEVATMLRGLREGLIVLGEGHRILVINPAARQILNAGQGDLLHKPLLEINRHETLMRILSDNGGSGEMRIGGRTYHVSSSPSEGETGIVLLLQDITEAQSAEHNRKQFTANVSHELRTPLTTISGYAELLETGLAKPEDTEALGTKIHAESKRLLSLVEDILRLSKLDEGITKEKKPVELYMLAQACVSKLRDYAEKSGIGMAVQGVQTIVTGDRTLLEEMVINLIDNAIKYNKPNGSVAVLVGTEDGQPFIAMKDTGLGIPPEHQHRVFERFYRVDSSRSKETGGTGLGLSIVKNGAQLHGATVQLQSEPDKGTTITIRFPGA
ncbi:MAG: PAS domain-containing sensor histidine kinase [Clostridiales bacterium]|nr:PAS domain-containing sensor histidine kinase [Clostridiales bacterium]